MGSKHGLLIKFGQFMSHYKRTNFIKKFLKFEILAEIIWNSFKNEIFEGSYLYYICNSKAIEICPNRLADLFIFLFTEDFLKVRKGLELVSRSQFSQHFLIKDFPLKYYINWPTLSDCVYFPSYLVKRVSCFILGHLMTSWHLNTWKVKIWLIQERKELSRWNKKHSSLFHKCSLLDIKNRVAKM